jgi:hypothetical protein
MSSKLVHVGKLAEAEMADEGYVPNPAFDRAAIKAARAAGLSDDEIKELFHMTTLDDGEPS